MQILDFLQAYIHLTISYFYSYLYYLFRKSKMCLLLKDSCSANDDDDAVSGKENCPPGK